MFVKFPLHFSPSSLIRIVCWVLFIPQFLCRITTCPPPDFPEGGRYEPLKREYEVGQTVTYSCNGRVPIIDEKKFFSSLSREVTCQSSGNWSEGTPFCETPVKLKSQVASVLGGFTILQVFDGNFSTCSRIRSNSEEVLAFNLDYEVTISSAVLCFGEGRAIVKITVFDFLEIPAKIDNSGSPNIRCYFGIFKGSGPTKFIIVHILTDSLPIIACELTFFSKDGEWCELPPTNSVPNGQLEVSHSKAVLHCKEGFKEKNGTVVYATCKNNTWLYQNLQCVEGTMKENDNILENTPQEDYKKLAITVVSVIIAGVLMLILTLLLIRSKRITRLCASF